MKPPPPSAGAGGSGESAGEGGRPAAFEPNEKVAPGAGGLSEAPKLKPENIRTPAPLASNL